MPLPVILEKSPELADWLGVQEVMLVREDKLPDQGGKKRRALESFARKNKTAKHLHLLSYAGSHTAFTLSKLMPDTMIHLYGTRYGGGDYERKMTELVEGQKNVVQQTGSVLGMSIAFRRAKRFSRAGHLFMHVGGSLGEDAETGPAVDHVLKETGNLQHYVAVASGDLFKTIQDRTERVTGVLTQPFLIRLMKRLKLPGTRGLLKPSLSQRVQTIQEVSTRSHETWDPVFMGTVLHFLKGRRALPERLCIWVTCPSGIPWFSKKDRLNETAFS